MPSTPEKDLFNLTAEMYECAAGAHDVGWLSVYEKLSTFLSSGPGSIHFLDKTSSRFEAFADTNEAGFIDRFNEEYFPIHPARKKILYLGSGQDFIRSRDCPDEIYKNSTVYQEYLRDRGIDFVLHRCLYESQLTSIGITFTRPRKLRPFDKVDLSAFDSVAGHLTRAIGLFVKVREAAAGTRMAIAAWDNIPQGALILSLSGELVFANLAAAKYFESEAFRINKDRTLSLGNNIANGQLSLLLHGILRPKPEGPASFGGRILLERPDSRPIVLTVSPFEEQGVIGLRKKYALLLITDPSANESHSESFLRDTYRLTAAEIRLAQLLAKGNSLKQAAELLGITHNTARTHLKRIFGKTSVNRQSSLVRLILAGDSRTPNL